MLLKKIGAAATTLAAVGMVIPMAAGFANADSTSTAANRESQHTYRMTVKSADDLVNEIENEKVNKYHVFIEAEVQHQKQEPVRNVQPADHLITATTVKEADGQGSSVHDSTMRKPLKVVTPELQKSKPVAVKPVKVSEAEEQPPRKSVSVKQTIPVEATRNHLTEASVKTNNTVQPKSIELDVKPQTVSAGKNAAASQPVTARDNPSTTEKQIQAAAPVSNHPSVQLANQAKQETGESSAMFTLTAYSLKGTTATGVNLTTNPNARVIAVDPSVIPLGSTVTIPGLGTYTAADTGSAIQGNRIDIHMSTEQAALNFGKRSMQVIVHY
ncbi:3D domain-containing protein [Sporolactobacillus pectinivorans]|uniref:3D domain-containing protein n=1 Tax=Sporolactobacillus pectinivorans TaxID=1591408 RepID=UPI0019619E3F|nr:3D domain-containing protein [Sporolactobacillus pectinivorans]